MPVEHNSSSKKFYIPLKESEAYLKYNLNDHIMNILSVVVPEEDRNKGIAERLTLYVFRYAKKKSLKIIPTCPYVRNTFIKKHKEFDEMIISS